MTADSEQFSIRKLLLMIVLSVALGLAPIQPVGASSLTQPTPVVFYLETSRPRRRSTALSRTGKI